MRRLVLLLGGVGVTAYGLLNWSLSWAGDSGLCVGWKFLPGWSGSLPAKVMPVALWSHSLIVKNDLRIGFQNLFWLLFCWFDGWN